jgi:hypothetical protein
MPMIRHIVLFKLKPTTTAEEKQLLASTFDRLSGKINGLLRVEVFEDVLQLEDSFDMGLFVLLADRASLNNYGESQERQAASQLARSLCERVVLFDHEMNDD